MPPSRASTAWQAARRTFRQLLAPAIVALLADLVGFVTILLIPVQVIREMAVTASIGVAIVILTDLVLLPVLVSYVHFDAGYHARVERRQRRLERLWQRLAGVTARGPALAIIGARGAAGGAGLVEGARDAHRRYPGRGAGAARRLALQPRQRRHHLEVQHRRRRADRDRRVPGAGVRQPRPHDRDRSLRLAHAQRAGRAGRRSRCPSSPRSRSPAGTRAASSGAAFRASRRSSRSRRATSRPAPDCSTRTATSCRC